MQKVEKRYPEINIKSKNELAKRISSKKFPYEQALELINDVIKNFNLYWRDNIGQSEPEKNKYVRSCKGTPLGKLLALVDKRILKSHDSLIPEFIFGGLSKRNHVQAAYYLLGNQRKRTKLSLDIKRFFERNSQERVFYFFYKKCKCSVRAARLLSDICCVPMGPKGMSDETMTLARGFATSSRLSLWCNLDLFLRINWKVNKILKGHNPKLALFVDDIGISASRVSKNTIEKVVNEVEKIFNEFDPNQSLPLNAKKQDIGSYLDDSMEHLGLQLGRNRLSIGKKTTIKKNKVSKKLRTATSKDKRAKLLKKRISYVQYEKYVNNIHKQ